MPDTTPCPNCGRPTEWDTYHQPVAWRHVHSVSRWCDTEGGNPPAYPAGCANPNRSRPDRSTPMSLTPNSTPAEIAADLRRLASTYSASTSMNINLQRIADQIDPKPVTVTIPRDLAEKFAMEYGLVVGAPITGSVAALIREAL